MLQFSIPADFSPWTLQKIYELNHHYTDRKVTEVYGQITTGYIKASGRNPDELPKIDLNKLTEYIRQCHKYGIEFNYTLNASCMGNIEFTQAGQFKQFLLSIDSAGVSSYTAALPSIIDLVKKTLPHRKLKASAICEINSPAKARHYKQQNIERIVVDPDITRRFDLLKNICLAFGENVEIIVNNACVQNCPYKMFHYNHEAHCGSDISDSSAYPYYYHKCSLQKAATDYNFIKLNWIRPEDLHFYKETGIKCFKIHGRNYASGASLLKVVRAYFNEKFDGNLMDLLTVFKPYNAFQPIINNNNLDGFLQRFFEHPQACSENCEVCGYCRAYAQKSMDLETVRVTNTYAQKLYTSIQNESL